MSKANVVLDATVLTSLMSCPRKADLRFNHNLVPMGGKSNSLECGSIVHVFMEYYYGNIVKGVSKQAAFGFAMSAAQTYIEGCKHCTSFIPYHNHPVTSENDAMHIPCSANCILKPICGHKPNEFPGVTNTPKDNQKEPKRTGWSWVLETCSQYAEFYRNDHWIPLETEVVKSKLLYEDDEVKILWKAKLDWTVDTNQGIFPVDHKTMAQNRKSTKLNNQFIGQCLIMGTQNVFINKIGFQTTLPPKEKFIRELKSYSQAQLAEWQGEILPYYAKLLLMYNETGYFPPNFDSCEGRYGNCNFLDKVCSSDPDQREHELKLYFQVGEVWNPTNSDDEVGDE